MQRSEWISNGLSETRTIWNDNCAC